MRAVTWHCPTAPHLVIECTTAVQATSYAGKINGCWAPHCSSHSYTRWSNRRARCITQTCSYNMTAAMQQCISQMQQRQFLRLLIQERRRRRTVF